jgi:transcriptional regulator with XRE-family HTH domain
MSFSSKIGDTFGMAPRQRSNVPPLATLLRSARAKLGLSQKDLAKRFQVVPRTLSRWEAGLARPTLEWRDLVAEQLSGIDGETWRAIVKELVLPLDEMLEKCPRHKALLPAAAAPLPFTTTTHAPMPDARAALDAIVRAAAEELDVTAKRLRSALGNVLADIARLQLAPLDARELVLNRGEKPGAKPTS